MAIDSDEVKAQKLKMLVKTTAIELEDLNTEKLNWFKYVIEISKGNDNVSTDTKRKTTKLKLAEGIASGLIFFHNAEEILYNDLSRYTEYAICARQLKISGAHKPHDEAFRDIISTAPSPLLSVIGPLDDEDEKAFPNALLQFDNRHNFSTENNELPSWREK
ncbi:13477_t:CDS:2 [Ambispora leptoticha]|uniref:13477_t:CDS:1 n=1 Tax=Ambispora leptoticha TaxID=144679 RepID=A0A9N9BNX3_9GLOM|nr:13477_t:CDS:2 [Ambispora leptoticha]